jgi:acetyl esterase
MTTQTDDDAEALERDVAEVHPELRDVYRVVRQAMIPDVTKSAATRRAEAEAGPGIVTDMVEEVELHEVRDLEIPVDGGVIPARLYRPTADATLPGYVHFHGGGWFIGSVDASDRTVRMLASKMGAAVVSVGYRLAPEHMWPTAPEDCFAATRWVHDHAAELGIDGDDLVVGGDSAGGNLAAAVALMCRDRGGPALAAQWLMIGMYDLTLPDSPSLDRYGKGFALDRDEMHMCLGWYVAPDDRHEPYASPMFADLAGLPPAVLSSASCDPLYDQSVEYAERLRAAGVGVVEVRCEGHLHGSMLLTGLSASAREHTRESVAALAAARARRR